MSRRRRFKPLLVTSWFDGTPGSLGQVLAEEMVAVSVPMRRAVRHHPRRQLDRDSDLLSRGCACQTEAIAPSVTPMPLMSAAETRRPATRPRLVAHGLEWLSRPAE
jgi:hypothetical protein